MAALNISTSLGDLKVLFNKIKHVYFNTTPGLKPSEVTECDYELPIVEDTVEFNTGEPDVTRVKLTTGDTWTSIASAGDAEITLQISSLEGSLLELFFEKRTESAEALGGTLSGNTYEGNGYSFSSPKKVNGGLLMTSADEDSVIYIPDVEMYANLEDSNDVPMFINVACTPTVDKNNVQIYLLPKKKA